MKIVTFLTIFTGITCPLCCCDRVRDSTVYSSLSTKHEYKTEDNITNIIESNNAGLNVTEVPSVVCEVARIKCALRQGCGTALKAYMLDCADLMHGRLDHCDEFCKASLIALTSTEEGENLMDCQCSDDFCSKAKGRLNVCREEVILANAQNAVVSCNVAHLICSADTSCSTALYYYDKFCRRMFSGRSCSFRCNNSISILERQQKAEKLSTCFCDGSEPFACETIKTNMAALCFNQKDEKTIQKHEEETNLIEPSQPGTNGQDGGNQTISSGCRHSFNSVIFAWLFMVEGLWPFGGREVVCCGRKFVRWIFLVVLTSSVIARGF